MPLPDRHDFQAWFTHRNDGQVGRREDDPTVCDTCGSTIDHALGGKECLVCLAEQFGTEATERRIAEAIADLVRAAADPDALTQMLLPVSQRPPHARAD